LRRLFDKGSFRKEVSRMQEGTDNAAQMDAMLRDFCDRNAAMAAYYQGLAINIGVERARRTLQERERPPERPRLGRLARWSLGTLLHMVYRALDNHHRVPASVETIIEGVVITTASKPDNIPTASPAAADDHRHMSTGPNEILS
jgi:hypothetical protein